MPSTPTRRRAAARLAAAVFLAAIPLLATASPAGAAGLDSITPNPAPPNTVLTVTANCDDTAAPSATVIYYHFRADGFAAVNQHQNIIPLGSDPDNKPITDSYDTSGIESPGIEEGDYYQVLVICFIPEQESPEFLSDPIPIATGNPPVDPPVDPPIEQPVVPVDPPVDPPVEQPVAPGAGPAAQQQAPPVNPGLTFKTGVDGTVPDGSSIPAGPAVTLAGIVLMGAAGAVYRSRRGATAPSGR